MEFFMVNSYNDSWTFLQIDFSIYTHSKNLHISFTVSHNLGLSGLEIGKGLLRIF